MAQPPRAATDRRVPVAVHINCDVGACVRLQNALEGGLRRDRRLRLAVRDEEEIVTIETRGGGIALDRLGGRAVLVYVAYVHRGIDLGDGQAGVCYWLGLSKCVRDLLRIAVIEAEGS